MKGRELKRVWGPAFDSYYLLLIERRKLQEMSKYFNKFRIISSWQDQVKEINLCIKLIDITIEHDSYYNNWLKANYGKHKESQYKVFSKYVNIKNAKRFNYTPVFDHDSIFIRDAYKMELRKIKAFYLYNKIRNYKMLTWWN